MPYISPDKILLRHAAKNLFGCHLLGLLPAALSAFLTASLLFVFRFLLFEAGDSSFPVSPAPLILLALLTLTADSLFLRHCFCRLLLSKKPLLALLQALGADRRQLRYLASRLILRAAGAGISLGVLSAGAGVFLVSRSFGPLLPCLLSSLIFSSLAALPGYVLALKAADPSPNI